MAAEIPIEELVKRAASGDDQAVADLYTETSSHAYYLALQLVKDDDAAQDILQDAYVKALMNLNTLQDPSKFQSWLNSIVVNTGKNYLKKRQPILFSQMESNDDDNEPVDFADESEAFSPEAAVDYGETKRLVKEMIDRLPEQQRIAILLYYMEDYSVGQIADFMGCSDGTVKSRLNYGRRQIEKDVLELEKQGTKLYCAPLVPFLFWMFHTQVPAATISAAATATLTAGVATGAGVAAGAGTGAAVAGGTVTGAGVAAGTTAGASVITGSTVGASVGAGSAVGATVSTGSTMGAYTAMGSTVGATTAAGTSVNVATLSQMAAAAVQNAASTGAVTAASTVGAGTAAATTIAAGTATSGTAVAAGTAAAATGLSLAAKIGIAAAVAVCIGGGAVAGVAVVSHSGNSSSSKEPAAIETIAGEPVMGSVFDDGMFDEDWDASLLPLPYGESLDMRFTAGADDWYTDLTVSPDGSFSGDYVYEELIWNEETQESNYFMIDHPFYGDFTNFQKIDDYSCSMTLESVQKYENEFIFGIQDGTRFILYLPGADLSDIADEALGFIGAYDDSLGHELLEYGRVSACVLRNVDKGNYFVADVDIDIGNCFEAVNPGGKGTTTGPCVAELFEYTHRWKVSEDEEQTLNISCEEIVLNDNASDSLRIAVSVWNMQNVTYLERWGEDELLECRDEDYYRPGPDWPYPEQNYYIELGIDNGKYLSFLLQSDIYTGGSHADHIMDGITFNAQTGEIATLESLTPDFQTFSNEVIPYIESYLHSNYTLYDNLDVMFAGNANETVEREWYDGTIDWYMNDEGLTFIFSSYEIAPFSEGTPMATYPMELLREYVNI